ncbi:MAG: hypothetical protein KatS3mg103_0752 [Phycisphaerales bacterium]|nr:MAG: hypothetical protein KatS3mg103_0752 [Phycisphaerales bacterium]
MRTSMSGRMPASSQASRALSTASLTVVSSALRGLSKPSRWRFLAKNSLTEMSRCRPAMASAVTRAFEGVRFGATGAKPPCHDRSPTAGTPLLRAAAGGRRVRARPP